MTWTTEDARVSSAARPGEPPAFDAREASAQVAADMTAAFATWVDLRPGAAARGVRRFRFGPGEAGEAPKRGRLNLVAAVSVGVLVGVSVGALLARPHRAQAPPQSPPADTAPPLALSAAVGSAPPRRLRIETEPSLTIQPPPSRLAQASPPVGAAPPIALGRIDARPERYPGDGSWSGRRSVAWNAPPPREMAGGAPPSTYPQAGWRGQSWPGPPSPTAGAQPDCFGQIEGRRRDCLIAASGRADAALRASYRQAAMAGVPNEVLEQDTQSWNDLRWRGGAEPEQMIAGYRRLTATLHAQAAAARRDRVVQDRGYGWSGQPYPSRQPYSPWD